MRCSAENFISRLQNQKEDALEYVIEQYSGFVNAIAYKILSGINKDSIDDCVNDVFLAIWQNAKQFKGEPEDFKKWIGMLTKYKAIALLYRPLNQRLHCSCYLFLLGLRARYGNKRDGFCDNSIKLRLPTESVNIHN
ncbi:sigma factor [Lysinibacillus xylanilyticus]|uniref:sigma factor n=1 Tax=Lysinibacillus xylanilyticus TaxID=582475 RepID=UPI00380AACFC